MYIAQGGRMCHVYSHLEEAEKHDGFRVFFLFVGFSVGARDSLQYTAHMYRCI